MYVFVPVPVSVLGCLSSPFKSTPSLSMLKRNGKSSVFEPFALLSGWF